MTFTIFPVNVLIFPVVNICSFFSIEIFFLVFIVIVILISNILSKVKKFLLKKMQFFTTGKISIFYWKNSNYLLQKSYWNFIQINWKFLIKYWTVNS